MGYGTDCRPEEAELGGVRIQFFAGHDIRQTYEPLTREALIPMGDGSVVKQVYAGSQTKIRTTISGTGSVPPGIQGLDFTQPLLLRCAAHKGISSSSNEITIPAERRADAGYEVRGRAYLPDNNSWIETPVNMIVNLAQLTLVPSATLYQVMYYPMITVFVEGGLDESMQVLQKEYTWSLTMRQI